MPILLFLFILYSLLLSSSCLSCYFHSFSPFTSTCCPHPAYPAHPVIYFFTLLPPLSPSCLSCPSCYFHSFSPFTSTCCPHPAYPAHPVISILFHPLLPPAVPILPILPILLFPFFFTLYFHLLSPSCLSCPSCYFHSFSPFTHPSCPHPIPILSPSYPHPVPILSPSCPHPIPILSSSYPHHVIPPRPTYFSLVNAIESLALII